MIVPQVFVPRRELAFEPQLDDDTCLGLIEDSNPLLAPVGPIRDILLMRYPLAPQWSEWGDQAGGVVSLVDKDDNNCSMSFFEESGHQMTPYNKDGLVIHEDEFVLLTLGVELGEKHGVLWGVISHDIETLQVNSSNLHVYRCSVEGVTLRPFFRTAYPK